MSVDAALRETLVREVMVKRLQTVASGEVVREALRLMVEADVGSLIVVALPAAAPGPLFLKDVRGMVPVFFALRSSIEEGQDAPVERAMFREAVTIQENETLATALGRVTGNKAWRLLVLDSEDQVIGLVSVTDILRFIQQRIG